MRAVLPVFGILVAAACAADEQWLQYRVHEQPYVLGIESRSVEVPVLNSVPEDIRLPDSAGYDILYGKWITPMSAEGFLYLAAAKGARTGPYDRLFVDSNADGALSDETALERYAVLSSYPPLLVFQKVRILFQAGDGPIAYHLNIGAPSIVPLASGFAAEPRLTGFRLSNACWYEGDVFVAGRPYRVALLDGNLNGAFDDPACDDGLTDMIGLRGETGRFEFYRLGKYLKIGGALCHASPAHDGACVTVEVLKDVPIGTISGGGGVTALTIVGDGQLDLAFLDGKAEAPAGRWTVSRWLIRRADKSGREWEAQGFAGREGHELDVAAGSETVLELGEPFLSTFAFRAMSQHTYDLSDSLRGVGGEVVTLRLAGGQLPPAPKLRIRNADGSYDQVFQFQYG